MKIQLENEQEPEFKISNMVKHGSLYIKQPKQHKIVFVEDFEDKQDDLLKMNATTDEPGNIIWANYKVLPQNRRRRILFSVLLQAIYMMCVGFINSDIENKFDGMMPEDYQVVVLDYDNSTDACSGGISES
jgi:hypothetical protein